MRYFFQRAVSDPEFGVKSLKRKEFFFLLVRDIQRFRRMRRFRRAVYIV